MDYTNRTGYQMTWMVAAVDGRDVIMRGPVAPTYAQAQSEASPRLQGLRLQGRTPYGMRVKVVGR